MSARDVIAPVYSGCVRKLIVFDGDDTLWRVEQLYDDARNHAADVVAEAGFDANYWLQLQKQIDLCNVRTLGLSRQRFPVSSVLAYEQFLAEGGYTVDPVVKKRIWDASSKVFESAAPLVPGAKEAVECLARTHRLALLTQGDTRVQRKRIADSGLSHFFELIEIVELKSSASFTSLLWSARTAASDAWSVGNSLPSDIGPALQAGMSAVWIDAHVWDYERRVSGPLVGDYYACESLQAVEAVVSNHSLVGQ